MEGNITNQDFINLFNEIIEQQSIILGPDIATIMARKVSGMKISDEGKVISIEGDPQQLLETLINEYVSLSGLIVKKTIEPLLTKHPVLAAGLNAAGKSASSAETKTQVASQANNTQTNNQANGGK